MQAFQCRNCPLVFEIGAYVYWELDGDTDRLVCVACGVMHRLDFSKPKGTSGPGITTLFALPEPVRAIRTVFHDTEFGERFPDYEWSFSEDDWMAKESWAGRKHLESLCCSGCSGRGTLISLEHPRNSDGCWPIFRDKEGNEHCPVCKGPLDFLYDVTIN